MTRTVLIFAKPPRIGLSKTRLAATMGKGTARRIAHFTMARTLRAACDTRWHTVLYVAPDSALPEHLGGLWPARLERASQGRGDLGARLSRGYSQAAPGKVIFLGADTPDISPAHIWRAFRLLDRHTAVFGPANDGGFWLLGLHRGLRPRAPFDGVRWSTAHALGDVRTRIGSSAKIAYLPELMDIDTAADWKDWSHRSYAHGR